MEITSDTIGDKLVVSPVGRIDSATSRAFEAALLPLLGRPGVAVIDCAKLTYVSSAGLRAFLAAAKTAKASGGKVVLCSLGGGVEEVFEVSGFARIIEIHPTMDAALASPAR